LIWNGLLHFGFLLVIAYLLDRLRAHIEVEQELARSDHLTGIFNRRAFLEQLQFRCDLAAREGKPITLAYIDLDDFKRINDSSGHDEGDRILRLVASTVANSVRRTDVVARLGGDEFALLIAGADRTGAEGVIAKVMDSLRETLDCEKSVVTCSIGCVTYLSPPIDAATAIGAADALMYEVKNQGKNAVAFEVIDDQPRNSAEAGAGARPPRATVPLRSQVAARGVERRTSIEPSIKKIVPRT
jgi:diguanylate cyclase (GGDEF)-like protein